MIKQIHFNSIFYVSFAICLTITSLGYAQEKKSRRAEKEKSNTVDNGSVDKLPGSSKPTGENTKTRSSWENYNFVVFVNPADEVAQETWKNLPGKISGLDIVSSGIFPQAYFIFTNNPEIALFRRAYGAYFQIFSVQDLDTFKDSLTCFKDLNTEFKALLEKRIGQ